VDLRSRAPLAAHVFVYFKIAGAGGYSGMPKSAASPT
jgi:hypothetical protein